MTSSGKEKFFYATGKRKTSTARVFLKKGTGQISVNSKKVEDFFPTLTKQKSVYRPLEITGKRNQVDALVTIKGGGVTGQSEALGHGLTRALVKFDQSLRYTLKKAGLITRDDRKVERKKYGRHKARRSTQFSKR